MTSKLAWLLSSEYAAAQSWGTKSALSKLALSAMVKMIEHRQKQKDRMEIELRTGSSPCLLS
jgi:hypothetical protein